jgi:ABC-type glycerol-3-phosphate transport system substrate-binding protein
MAALVGIESILFAFGMKLKSNLLTMAVYQGIEGESLKRVADRFSEQTGTRVAILSFPYDELYEQETLSLAAPRGNRLSRFDVIMLDDPWLEGLLAAGNSPSGSPLPLSQLPSPGQVDREDFFPSCLRVGQHPYCTDARSPCPSPYYALPFVGNAPLFCYRGPAGSQPPSTWDQIAGLPEKAGDRTGNAAQNRSASKPSYAMRLGQGNSIVTDFIPMLWASDPGGPLDPGSFGPTARAPLKPKTREAFLQLAELSANRNFGTGSLDDFDLAVYMLDGKATTSIMWSAYAMALANLKSGPDAMNGLQFAVVPGTPVLGAWLLAAPANREPAQQDLAKGFIAFATSRDQLAKAAVQGNPPPRRSVLTSRDFGGQYPGSVAAQRQSLEKTMPRPRWPDWKQVECRIGASLADLTAGLIGPDAALDEINHAIGHAPDYQSGAGRPSGCASRTVPDGNAPQP